MKIRRNVEGYYSQEKPQGELRGRAQRVIERENKIKEICLTCTRTDCDGICEKVDKRYASRKRHNKAK